MTSGRAASLCLGLFLVAAAPVGTAPLPTNAHVGTISSPAALRLSSEADSFTRAIGLFGGIAVEPARFPNTVQGFADYLQATGVRGVSAAELTRPHHPEVAARLGFQSFLPPQQWWSRGAALALMTERLNAVTGDRVIIRNWWRPAAYNADPTVGGAKNGDHPTANAVDLDYASPASRAKAERFLRSIEAKDPWLNLSLGLGAQTTHVGIGSPKGHREWHYAGWTPVG